MSQRRALLAHQRGRRKGGGVYYTRRAGPPPRAPRRRPAFDGSPRRGARAGRDRPRGGCREALRLRRHRPGLRQRPLPGRGRRRARRSASPPCSATSPCPGSSRSSTRCARRPDGRSAFGVEDTALLKRLVLKRCVYGVDLSPMGAEIAKVSLWLGSFVPGPLARLPRPQRPRRQLADRRCPARGRSRPAMTTARLSVFGDELDAAIARAAEKAASCAKSTTARPTRSRPAAAAEEELHAARSRAQSAARPLDRRAARPEGCARRGAEPGDAPIARRRESTACDRSRARRGRAAGAALAARIRRGLRAREPRLRRDRRQPAVGGGHRRGARVLRASTSPGSEPWPRQSARCALEELRASGPTCAERFDAEQERVAEMRAYLGPRGRLPGGRRRSGSLQVLLPALPGAACAWRPRWASCCRGPSFSPRAPPTSAVAVRGGGARALDFLLNSRPLGIRRRAPLHRRTALRPATCPFRDDRSRSPELPTPQRSSSSQSKARASRIASDHLSARTSRCRCCPIAGRGRPARQAPLGLARFRLRRRPLALLPGRANSTRPTTRALGGSERGLAALEGRVLRSVRPARQRGRDLPAKRGGTGKGAQAATRARAHCSPAKSQSPSVARRSERAGGVERAWLSGTSAARQLADGSRVSRSPRDFLSTQAPYLAFIDERSGSGSRVPALMNSLPFDWQARRFVETHLNFFILEGLRSRRSLMTLCMRSRLPPPASPAPTSASRSSPRRRGVECGPLDEEERLALRAEIDARVALIWGLSADELEVVFADFTLDAVPEAYRERVRDRFAELGVTHAAPRPPRQPRGQPARRRRSHT